MGLISSFVNILIEQAENKVKNTLINKGLYLNVGDYTFYYFFLDENSFWQFIDVLNPQTLISLPANFDKPSPYAVLYMVEGRHTGTIPKTTALQEALELFPNTAYIAWYDVRNKLVVVYRVMDGKLGLLLKKKTGGLKNE